MSIYRVKGQIYKYFPTKYKQFDYSNLYFPIHFTFGGFIRNKTNNSDYIVELWFLRDNFNLHSVSIYFNSFVIPELTISNELYIENKLDILIRTELPDFHIKWMLEFLNITLKKIFKKFNKYLNIWSNLLLFL